MTPSHKPSHTAALTIVRKMIPCFPAAMIRILGVHYVHGIHYVMRGTVYVRARCGVHDTHDAVSTTRSVSTYTHMRCLKYARGIYHVCAVSFYVRDPPLPPPNSQRFSEGEGIILKLWVYFGFLGFLLVLFVGKRRPGCTQQPGRRTGCTHVLCMCRTYVIVSRVARLDHNTFRLC